MKIRGNTVGTHLKPEAALGNIKNLTDEQAAQFREKVGAVSKEQVEEAIATGGGLSIDEILEALSDRYLRTKGISTDSLSIGGYDNDDNGASIVPKPFEEDDPVTNEPIGVLQLVGVWNSSTRLRGLAAGKEDSDAVNVKQFNDALGNVESALDGIIALQNSLIGGGSV